jgi:hypothetical protein
LAPSDPRDHLRLPDAFELDRENGRDVDVEHVSRSEKRDEAAGDFLSRITCRTREDIVDEPVDLLGLDAASLRALYGLLDVAQCALAPVEALFRVEHILIPFVDR